MQMSHQTQYKLITELVVRMIHYPPFRIRVLWIYQGDLSTIPLPCGPSHVVQTPLPQAFTFWANLDFNRLDCPKFKKQKNQTLYLDNISGKYPFSLPPGEFLSGAIFLWVCCAASAGFRSCHVREQESL